MALAGQLQRVVISVVVPMYNEAEGVRELHRRLSQAAASWNEDYELLFVNDGSRDATLEVCRELCAQDPHLRVVSLSRNFGHQAAVSCGMKECRGDWVAVIDADLQDPPEELARFFERGREGYDVVYAVRRHRKEGPLKRFSYWAYYRLLSFLADVEIPLDSGDFCVVSRRFLDELNRLPERRRFQRGLRAWLGFRQVGLEYERQARALGQPKYTLAKLINLGLDGIVNFSTRPMRLLMMLGIGLGAAAFALSLAVLAIYVADITLWGYNARQTQGWTSLILAIFFLSGTQLFGLGVLGEYIGRIFEEAKGRPTYVVEERLGSKGGDESA